VPRSQGTQRFVAAAKVVGAAGLVIRKNNLAHGEGVTCPVGQILGADPRCAAPGTKVAAESRDRPWDRGRALRPLQRPALS